MKALLNSIFFRSLTSMVLIFILITDVYAQQHNVDHQENTDNDTLEHSEHHEFKPWRIGFGIGHSYLPAGNHSSDKVSILVIPTIGLDIQYWFSPRFGLALKNEFEIISYVIERDEGGEIEREYPIISVLVGMYKLKNGPAFYLGAGIEYEKSNNFFIAKAGIEYELEIGKHWDVTPEFYYFNKDGDFGGIGLSITFGKRF